jgi:hypothetical protein
MTVQPHDSLAGKLLQIQIQDHAPSRAAAPLGSQACRRIFACGEGCSTARFACRQAPTKTRLVLPLELACRRIFACGDGCSRAWFACRQAPTNSDSGPCAFSGCGSPCRSQACRRIFACGDGGSTARFACRQAPTNSESGASAFGMRVPLYAAACLSGNEGSDDSSEV